MKNWKDLSRRGLALFLSLTMCLGMLQLTAYANSDEIVVEVGGTEDLSAKVPGLTGAWASSDESIVTVDEDGVVTGVSVGEATVTLTVEKTDLGEAPGEGGDDVTTPGEGGDDVTTPDEGGDDVTTPGEGGDDVTTPDEGGDDVTTPDEGSDDVTTPGEGGDDVTTPDEGSDVTTPADTTEGAPAAPSDTDGDYSVEDTDTATVYTWTVKVTEKQDSLLDKVIDGVLDVVAPVTLDDFLAAVAALPAPEDIPAEMPQEQYDALAAQLLELQQMMERLPEEEQTGDAFEEAAGLLGLVWEKFSGTTPVTLAETETVSSGNLSDVQAAINQNHDVIVTETIIVRTTATLDLKGHTITYTNAEGSVFIVNMTTKDNTFTLSDSVGGGMITGGKGTQIATNNPENSTWHEAYTAGGAILVMKGTLKMEGGKLYNNTANKGGGIYVVAGGFKKLDGSGQTAKTDAKLLMSDGIVDFNTAKASEGYVSGKNNRAGEGGGIWLGSVGNQITGGEITNNTSETKMDWGGGGIYVNNDGDLQVLNADITNNTAYGLGGGVAGCPHAHMALSVSDGAAIHANTAYKDGYKANASATAVGGRPDNAGLWQNTLIEGEGAVARVTGIVGDYLAYGDSEFTAAKAMDFYCVDACAVQGQHLTNDQGESWEGRYAKAGFEVTDRNKDGGESAAKPIDSTSGDVSIKQGKWHVVSSGSLGLTAVGVGSVTGKSVKISGNTSYTHGGGIACNGTLCLGQNTGADDNSNGWAIEANKAFTNVGGTAPELREGEFTFHLKKAGDTDLVATATNAADGTIRFAVDDEKYAGSKEGTKYSFTVVEDDTDGDPSINYDKTNKTVDVTVVKVVNEAIIGTTNYTATNSYVKSVVWTNDDKTFTNTLKPGSLSIKKSVAPLVDGTVPADRFTFEVKLGNGTVNATGNGYVANGKYTFELANGETATITNIPAGVTYTVEETGADKYTAAWTSSGTVENGVVSGTINANETAALTCTNTHKVASLAVKKVVTVNTPSSKEPNAEDVFEIKVKLGDGFCDAEYKNATEYKGLGNYIFLLKDKETATIEGIPVGTKYTVSEGDMPVDGDYYYTNTNKIDLPHDVVLGADIPVDEPIVVENHYYEAKYTNITVTKDWPTTPDEYKQPIEVTLVGGGDLPNVVRTVTLNKDNNWSHTWENLPVYEGDGKDAYTYTVTENSIEVPKDAKWSLDPKENGIIRVRSTENFAENAQGEKEFEILGGWAVDESDSSKGSETPDTIKLVNNWRGKDELGTASFTVYKYDSKERNTPIEGVKFELVTKTVDEDGKVVEVKSVDSGTTNENGIVTFNGLAVGTYYLREIEVAGGYRDDESNKGGEWKLDFTKDANQKDKLQKVEKVDGNQTIVGKNTWSWKASAVGSTTIGSINIYNEPIEGQIEISKVLDLDGVTEDITGKPAEKSFTFEVYPTEDVLGADTTKAVATLYVKVGENNAKKTGMLRYGTYIVKETGNTDLTDYTWTGVSFANVEENDLVKDDEGNVIGFKVKIEESKTYSFTATNTYERHTSDLSITKTVTGNRGDYDRGWKFLVTLKAPADYVELAEKYDAVVTKTETVNSVTTETKRTTTLERNEESGVYEIELTHNETAVISGLPVGVTYSVTEEGIGTPEFDHTVTTGKNTETATDNKTEVGGTIVKGETDKVLFNNHRSGGGNTNDPKTDVSVRKVWAGDGDIERPNSVTVELTGSNGTTQTVTLNEGNNWRHTWTGLDGRVTWSVDEVDVPEGYAKAVTNVGNSYTITNTYSEPDRPDDPDEPDIPDDDVPRDGGDEEIPDDDVPLANLPGDDETDIPDEEIPLDELPATGDESNMGLWALMALSSGLAALWLALTGKKHKDEEA